MDLGDPQIDFDTFWWKKITVIDMAYFDTLNTCQNRNFLPIWIGVQVRFRLSHWLVNHSGFGVSPYSAVTTMSAWCQPGNLTKFSRQKLVLFGIFCFWAISTDKVEMKNMRIGIIIRGKNFKGALSFVPSTEPSGGNKFLKPESFLKEPIRAHSAP